VIGTGGMGVVVAAHHLGLDTRVAIKLMRPELRARREFVRRFVREARAAARLNSRHVARVFDVGLLEDGAPYIVMEYLDGIDLARWIRERGPAPVSLAAAFVLQACDAIAEAHAGGIIHRDLKPSNLLVVTDRDGEPLVKVLDLGICKLLSRGDEPEDTSTGPPLGTPLYMAPEQLAAAGHADARSDLWSLGAILHELVTGRAPFHGCTIAELRARVASEPCPELERTGVPGEFAKIVARCLARDPAARFQRVAELAEALAPFASDLRPPCRAAVAMRRTRRARWWALLAAVAVALVAGDALQPAQPRPGRSAPVVEPAAPRTQEAPRSGRVLEARPATGMTMSSVAQGLLEIKKVPDQGPNAKLAVETPHMFLVEDDTAIAVKRIDAPTAARPPSVPAAPRPIVPREVEPRLSRVQPRPTNARAHGEPTRVLPIPAPRDRGSGAAPPRVPPLDASAPSVAPVDPLATPY
jgi:serine/threonine-protein kinase